MISEIGGKGGNQKARKSIRDICNNDLTNGEGTLDNVKGNKGKEKE